MGTLQQMDTQRVDEMNAFKMKEACNQRMGAI
jgi:hypothetical protein